MFTFVLLVMKYSRGKHPNCRNGFKDGHTAIPGTEKTRFKKGLIPWNKGKGVGTNRIKLKYRTYKFNAKRRGFTFDVTLDQMRDFLKSKCIYCEDAATGIDRVDNSLGYIDGNMVACCSICNHMKYILSRQDFIDKCRQIVTVTGYEI